MTRFQRWKAHRDLAERVATLETERQQQRGDIAQIKADLDVIAEELAVHKRRLGLVINGNSVHRVPAVGAV